MKYFLTFLFRLAFISVLCAVVSAQQLPRTETDSNYLYGKYETDDPAILFEIPLPALTPEATKFFQPGEMMVEAVLRVDGTVSNVVFRGFLKNGMGDRVNVAVQRIKFRPAKVDGRLVSQKVTIKYGIKRCKNGKICTYAREYVE